MQEEQNSVSWIKQKKSLNMRVERKKKNQKTKINPFNESWKNDQNKSIRSEKKRKYIEHKKREKHFKIMKL